MDIIESIEYLLQQQFEEGDTVELSNPSGDRQHYQLLVVSESFDGKSRLDRSRIVHNIVGDFLKSGKVHSISMKLKSKNEIPAAESA